MSPTRDHYTHGHHESVLRSHIWRTAENSAGYLLPHLRPDLRLLDVGCGPATITIGLAGILTKGSVVGLEPLPGPLQTARANANDAGINNIEFVLGDVYALDFADDSFDVVHAHQVLQHLSNPVAALKEMTRVCKPGGLLAIRDADYAAMSWYPPSPHLDAWQQIYHAVGRANNAEPDAGRFLKAWALRAGLQHLTVSSSVWCYATADELSWWSGLWADRITASAFGAQAVADGHSSAARLNTIAAEFRRWGTDPEAVFLVPSTEVLARVQSAVQGSCSTS